jgi:two-component system, OmpR family, KDP operon response regulator KdpE
LQRVLVIGEGPDEARALALRLGLAGYDTSASASVTALALRSIIAFRPDILILQTNGRPRSRRVFQLLAEVTDVPIVVTGPSDAPDDLIWYLENGAADYVSAPVSPSVLAARLGALSRSAAVNGSSNVLRAGPLEIDLERRVVRKNGEAVSLTPTEFRLLQVLSEKAGAPCSHRYLLERVWGSDFRSCSHYLRLYIGYLRQKLEADPKRPTLLVTEWGVGYRLVNDAPVQLPAASPARARYA